MKIYTFLLIISSLLVTSLNAQQPETISIDLSDPSKPGFLKLYNHNGTIDIEGHAGANVEIVITSKSGAKKDRPSRKGLKRIANNAMGVTVTEEDNYVHINSSNNNRKDYQIKVPRKFSLNVSAHHNGEINITNVIGDLEVNSHHGAIFLEKVGGSVIADTHHGEIKVSFTEVSSGEPMAFTTYHGDVDISFPSNLEADVKMKSAQGDIYTDFEFDTSKPNIERKNSGSKKEIKVSGWTFGKIGRGGPEFRFDTYHGDIIVRKNG